ncbi:MAG: hypothetical protein O8C67_08900 [Candidatus Methanoperedens sp.]|nr:hypothetical protein [Candidatus Methanoperedens sp.]
MEGGDINYGDGMKRIMISGKVVDIRKFENRMVVWQKQPAA